MKSEPRHTEELRFDGRVAIVTGGGRGMGRSHATLLGARGASVVVNDPGPDIFGDGSDSGPAEEVAAAIRESGGKAVANNASVATAEGIKSILSTALETFGGIDIIINNAGIGTSVPFDDTTAEDIYRHLSVHLVGGTLLALAAWPHFVAKGYGRIVNTTSAAGLWGIKDAFSYAIAKSGVVGLTTALAVHGKDNGIKVNAVSPGAVTRMWFSYDADHPLPGQGIRHQLRPEQVSPIYAFLAHESCPVSGQIYACSAGRVSRVMIADTLGYISERLTPEQVRDHWHEIRDETGYDIPEDALANVEFRNQVVERFLRSSVKS